MEKNRVQAFLEKYENYHGNGEFQFIGTLQPNKVKYIIDKVTFNSCSRSLFFIKKKLKNKPLKEI